MYMPRIKLGICSILVWCYVIIAMIYITIIESFLYEDSNDYVTILCQYQTTTILLGIKLIPLI